MSCRNPPPRAPEPVQASTSDDYDNPQVLYGSPASVATPVADSSSSASQTPTLIDGYLL